MLQYISGRGGEGRGGEERRGGNLCNTVSISAATVSGEIVPGVRSRVHIEIPVVVAVDCPGDGGERRLDRQHSFDTVARQLFTSCAIQDSEFNPVIGECTRSWNNTQIILFKYIFKYIKNTCASMNYAEKIEKVR